MTSKTPTLAALAADLASGKTSARALLEACLGKIDDPGGQGGVAFVSVDKDGARAAADATDALRAENRAPSPFAGIPIAIKDLFDIAGQVTRAGSRVLDNGPVLHDAPAVARLRKAGFVLIGRSNMTEFAFSGLGLNPHYGTPLSPWRRDERHLAGGSTSGGAAAVADEMAHGSLGTDTGGSCRIPAAWCGLVGFKPTSKRVPREGAVPLSTTLDSVGPIARSVDCVATLDAILAGEADPDIARKDLRGLRLASVLNVFHDGVVPEVADAHERAVGLLEAAGAKVESIVLAPIERLAAINSKGGFASAESYAWHRHMLAEHEPDYDPRVAVRIKRGASQSAVDYIELLSQRRQLIADVTDALAGYDAMLAPTTPITPPRLTDVAGDDDYGRINLLALRNPSVINMIDGCSISLPVHRGGEAPVGLMVAALGGHDRELLAIAQALEGALRAER